MPKVERTETGFRSASELPALVSYLRERRCILFVGAGLSRPAGYPGWGELMRQVVEATSVQLGDAAGKEELESLLAQSKFAEVADQCRTLLGRTFFGRLLRSILARSVQPPEDTHRAIVQTPYACVVTTNFDTLLEDAFAKWSDFGIPRAPTGMELAQHGTLLLDGAFFVLKAHGTIHDDASMVFTSEDYRRITHANPAFQAVMSSLLLSHAVLFVGYSLGDPNFRLLMDSQLSTFGSDAPPRYALMENVGAAEREILRRTAGIEVISFAKGAYGEVAGLLQYLERECRDVASSGTAGTAGTARAPSRRRTVLRPPPASDVFVLRLQSRDIMIDSTWYQTTTRDLVGSALVLEQMTTSTSSSPPLQELQQLIPKSLDTIMDVKPATLRRVGALLSDAIPGAGDQIAQLKRGLPVMLDVAPELASLPWEWMLAGRTQLLLQRPVCRLMPGITDASRGRPLVRAPLRALLIGDTMADSGLAPGGLPGARAEVAALARLIRQAAPGNTATVLLGRAAAYHRVLHELRTGRYDVVHYSSFSSQDDAGSFLVLHDGRVTASELVTLLIKRPPALLFVNSIYSGFVPAFSSAFPVTLRAGMSYDDHYRALRRRRVGFERAAARSGVGTFVGVMGMTTDAGASAVAEAFYRHMLGGRPAAAALHAARRAHAFAGDSTNVQLAMAGYPDLRLTADVLVASRSGRRPPNSAPRMR